MVVLAAALVVVRVGVAKGAGGGLGVGGSVQDGNEGVGF